MSEPRVSVGLPVYNGQNYLRQSIEAILNQDVADLELVICDNASTDATEEICRSFAALDSRVRYFRQEKNVGFARNANRAFELSRGEYFKWAAHDDLHGASFLSRCVPVLDQNPSIVLVMSGVGLIDGEGRDIPLFDRHGRPEVFADPPRRLASPRPHQRFADVILSTNWVLEFYGLMRVSALRRTLLNGPYFGSDKRLIAELSLLGPFAEVPEKLFFYRHHPAQQSTQKSASETRHLHWAGEKNGYSPIPRLVNLLGYMQALSRGPVSTPESMRCLRAIGAWFFQPRKLPGILMEAAQSLGSPTRGTLRLWKHPLWLTTTLAARELYYCAEKFCL